MVAGLQDEKPDQDCMPTLHVGKIPQSNATVPVLL